MTIPSINLQIREGEWIQNRINPKQSISWHIIMKLLKTKDKYKFLKAAREKQSIAYKEKTIQMTVNCSPEIIEVRGKWHNSFQVLKEKSCQHRILCWMKISFRHEGETEIFSD